MPDSGKKTVVAIWKKSGPLIFIAFSDLVTQFLRVSLLGKQGKAYLAANGFIYVFNALLLDTSGAFTDQNAVLVSNQFGDISDRDSAIAYRNIGNILRQGWYLDALGSIPASALVWSSGPILKSMGVKPELCDIVSDYFVPVGFGISLMLIARTNERFFSAVDEERWLPVFRLIVMIPIIPLSFLLIHQDAAKGAGMVFLIQSILRAAITTAFIACKENFRKYSILNFKDYSGHYMSTIAKQGTPSAIASLVVASANIGLALLIASLGENVLAIEQTVALLFAIVFTVGHGINEATNRLVAQQTGSANFKLAKQYGRLGMSNTTAVYAAFTLIYNIFPEHCAGLIMQHDDIQKNHEFIKDVIIIMTFAQYILVMLDASTQILNAYQDTLLSAITTLSSMTCLVLPLACISTFKTNLGLYGIGGSVTLGMLVPLCVVFNFWRKQANIAIHNNGFTPEGDTSNAHLHRFFQRHCTRFGRKDHQSPPCQPDPDSPVRPLLEDDSNNSINPN